MSCQRAVNNLNFYHFGFDISVRIHSICIGLNWKNSTSVGLSQFIKKIMIWLQKKNYLNPNLENDRRNEEIFNPLFGDNKILHTGYFSSTIVSLYPILNKKLNWTNFRCIFLKGRNLPFSIRSYEANVHISPKHSHLHH